MTITNENIVLAESQVMADTEDGGGRMSGNVVEEGAVNNTMPDVSRLDRVYGRVNFRKLFLSVRSANQDTLLGAHTMLLRKPVDPRVNVTLFKTGSHTDRRESARERVESYVVKASQANFWLWGDQLEGQRAISALQRPDAIPPETGQVYCLIDPDTADEQYIRVTEVTVGLETFYDSGGEPFELQTLQVSLANEIGRDFRGSEPSKQGKTPESDLVLTTQVADAARYYGAQPLAVTAEPGDLTVQLNSVYNYLVPSAQSESALTDRSGGPGQAPVVPASTNTITVSADDVTTDSGGFAIYYTGRAIVPGTLVIGGTNGSYSDAGGLIEHESGPDYLDESDINYNDGIVRIRWDTVSRANNPVTLTFIPGAAFSQQSYTASVEVLLQTRSLTWVYQPRPIPAPGTLVVEYRALGRWATLRDNGNGVLVGDGTGQINYATGTIEVTLAGLPDVGTEIIYSWGDDESFDLQDGVANPAASLVEFVIANPIT